MRQKVKCSLRIRYKRLYRCWTNMKSRCNNPNDPLYKYYGKRGIKVCDEWNSFENFFIWAMENGYNDTLTIDRVDVNGDYEPSNCRWATKDIQSFNQCSKSACDGVTHRKDYDVWQVKLCCQEQKESFMDSQYI